MRKLFYFLIFATMMSGCSALAPDVGFSVSSNEYGCIVGKRYEVIAPMKIVVWKDSMGEYWLMSSSNNDQDTKFVADVPVGSIMVVDHVSKSGGYWFRNEEISYIGRFETPGIFKGGFELSSVIRYNNVNYERPFCERFIGMQEDSLKELK